MSGLVLLFTCITGILAQDRKLQGSVSLLHSNANSQDCFNPCWMDGGFCEWCGPLNACCAVDGSTKAAECRGVNFQLGNGDMVQSGTPHRCVTAAFRPGEAAPNGDWNAGITDAQKAQCTGYMSQAGCGWTNQYSCPNQPKGLLGRAQDRTTVGYKCCCQNQLWKEATQMSSHANNPMVNQGQCSKYMVDTGCKWTAQYNCPGQPQGSQGPAGDDGSIGYGCCCRSSMWKTGAPTFNGNTNPNVIDPNAFDVDHDMSNNVADAGEDQVSSLQDNGFGVSVGAGQQVGNNVASNRNGDFFFEHKGPNVHTHTVAMTNPKFESSVHVGSIHNRFAKNNAWTKKERCQFGICADIDGNDPGNHNNLPDTQHGLPVLMGTQNKPTELPSIIATMDDGDKVPNIQRVVGGVAVASPVAGGGIIAPPAAVSATAGAAAPVLNARAAVVPVAAPGDVPAPLAASPAATAPLETTLSSATTAGATVLPVASVVGFLIGDQVLIGNSDRTTIVASVGANLTVSPAASKAYATGTPIAKIPAGTDQTAGGGSSATSSTSSSLSTSSAGYGWLVCLVLLCCLCIVGGGAGAFVLMRGKQQKQKRITTDREAYLKNDFIERQPVYEEEAQPMMAQKPMVDVNGADMNRDGIPDAFQGPMIGLEPTQSFPVQVELAQTASIYQNAPQTFAPVTEASGVAFPGLPTIGGGANFLQQTVAAAAPSNSMYFPGQAASMNMTLPYGNYTSQSAYVSAPSAYSQQLGVTTAAGFPAGNAALR